MLRRASGVRIWICREAVDMRRSFDGLSSVVEQVLLRDPLSGHWFVFRNRRGHLLKILCWEGDGFSLWCKRLERGVFRFPVGREELSFGELGLVLDGVEWKEVGRLPRFSFMSNE